MNKLKKYNKTFKFLMILGMFLNMLMPTGGITLVAEDGVGKDLGNIFKEPKIYLDNVEIESESKIEIKDGSKLAFKMNWELGDEVVLNKNDFATFTLPEQFKLLQKNEEGSLLDENEVVAGDFYLDKESNTLKVIFNEELVNKTDRNGHVEIAFSFDESKFIDDTSQTIKFETEPK